ncbi:flavin reductase family protein [Neobacillus notoginsengisoli]|uniref:Flavin reductase family protein n=1 Tax=Neobacillus notoginsengisoli TaxID=1578198 RepID=A0A417YX91_9BACI|nr:flavin reductase family protein [Neobacillus notoginsengisoli]RHW42110.1 flavin reductase family protein [Neobacillus notoginsengisoli]
MDFTPETMQWRDAYKLLIGSVLPRPIAFVSTMNKAGIANAAPFSFFTVISADPMLVCFSPMRRGSDGAKKDTLLNIEETQEFVINIVSEGIAEKMNVCATEFPSDVDEFEVSGLTKEPSAKVQPPRIKEAKVHLECELYEVHHYGNQPGSGSLVVGKVVHIHVDDHLYDRGRILTDQLNPIGRMAGNIYTRPLASIFEIKRIVQQGDGK